MSGSIELPLTLATNMVRVIARFELGSTHAATSASSPAPAAPPAAVSVKSGIAPGASSSTIRKAVDAAAARFLATRRGRPVATFPSRAAWSSEYAGTSSTPAILASDLKVRFCMPRSTRCWYFVDTSSRVAISSWVSPRTRRISAMRRPTCCMSGWVCRDGTRLRSLPCAPYNTHL